MDADELQFMLKEGEGLTVELKEQFSSKIDRDIVAFANSRGGYILLGVDDHGKVVGEKYSNELKAKITNLARNCEPAVAVASIEQVGDVVAIRIDESNEKPHSCSSGYFRRLDAATQKMNQKELKLLFRHSDDKPHFEKLTNEKVTWENISTSKIETFLSEAGIAIEKIEPKNILNSLELANKSIINNAGVLFFANHPRKFISQCEMILVAFKGSSGIHIYDRVNVQDDLISQFNQAMLFIKKHLNVRSEIKNINRKDIYEIPLPAIREAIVNAIIHRDYSMYGTSLMVEVHADRVVIKNPGGLPEGVNIESITQVSIRRNATIADIFARIEKAERIGSGVKRIMELIAAANLPKPEIQSNLFFSITFERDPQYASATTSLKADAQPSLSESDQLTPRQIEILRILEESNKSNAADIAVKLESPMAQRTIQRELQSLKELGLVDSNDRGRSTMWFLVRK